LSRLASEPTFLRVMASIRVLHVVARMNPGGVEAWLMHMLRNADPARARMDFLVTLREPGGYDAEIAARGSAVIGCESPRNPALFARRFLRVLRERGPYDVLHSHVHHFSGFVLAVARHAGVPVRIAHSHLDTHDLDAEAGLARRTYLALMRAALRRYATHGLAVSESAAAALFGARWRDDARWDVARCGLDFSGFRGEDERSSVRAELGLPSDALVLGHVGRFDPQKNHHFLVEIAAAAFRREPRARLVLVGDGPLRASVEADSRRLGIRERVVFAGIRSDVPRILRSLDAFVFPSLREGLPLVGLEAQAAGVPLVLSDSITRELVVIPELFTWVSVDEPAESWAAAALSAASGTRPQGMDPVAALEASEFSLSRSMSRLLQVYQRSA
jgi:glycosyltransferase involved in cell wall biosynthesis